MAIPQGTITEAFRKEFSDTFQQVFQQEESVLWPLLRQESQSAEYKSWDFIGETSGVTDRARQAATEHVAMRHMRRWNKNRSWTWSPDLIDDLDTLESMKSPQSAYTLAGRAAYGRWKDELVLQRLAAAVTAGKDADQTINYYDVGECRVMKSDGVMATAGSAETDATATGLTLEKIATLGKVLDDASVPQTGRVLVANTNQKWYLLGSTKATSADFNTVRALTNGELNDYLGFRFVWLPSDRFVLNTVEATGTCVDCWAFQRDSVLATNGKSLDVRVDQLPTHNYNAQIWAEASHGAVRLQGKGIVKVVLLKEPTISFS